jgi:hypothetical protein
MLIYVIIVLLVIGIALGAYAIFVPRRVAQVAADAATRDADAVSGAHAFADPPSPLAGLSEAERCEVVFAMAALGDDESREHLRAALNDPSETVALAAAHALANSGHITAVNVYAQQNPGPRSQKLLDTIALLG